jgi:hypothetical protein
VSVLLAGTLASLGEAKAAGGCGPSGACFVDGWGSGAPVLNECPAGARPRPPCGVGYVWRTRYRACFQN